MNSSGLPGESSTERNRQLLHYAKVGRFLEEQNLQRTTSGSGITLQLNDGALVFLHPAVAGAHSVYFQQLILRNGHCLVVNVSNYQPRAVKRAVDFLYSGSVEASLEELGDLLLIARAWQVPSLMSAMEEDLLRFANQPETRLKAFDIAARHEAAICASTRSEIYGSAEKDFRQLIESDEFTKLSPRAVYVLLSSDDLPVGSELEVASAVLAYIGHPSNRAHADQLLYVVRFEHLDAAEIAALRQLMNVEDPSLSPVVDRLLKTARTLHVMRPHRSRAAQSLPRAQGPVHGAARGNFEVTPWGTAVSKLNVQTQGSATTFPRPTHADVRVPSLGSLEYSPFVQGPSQECLNPDLRSVLSAYEIRNVPNLFETDTGRGPSNIPAIQTGTQDPRMRQYSLESLAELAKLPNLFVEDARFDQAQQSETVRVEVESPVEHGLIENRRLHPFSPASLRELPSTLELANPTDPNSHNFAETISVPNAMCYIVNSSMVQPQLSNVAPLVPLNFAQPFSTLARV